ncbi:MAG: hypothetical protein V1753_05995, partial [Pseudomonadota bacterium]
MNTLCKKFQELLAQEGASALKNDPAAQEHISGCDECFAFMEAISRIDEGLVHLPLIDAPDELVASVVEKVASMQSDCAADKPHASREGGAAASWIKNTLSLFSRIRIPRYVMGLGITCIAIYLFTALILPNVMRKMPARKSVEVSRQLEQTKQVRVLEDMEVKKKIVKPSCPVASLNESQIQSESIARPQDIGALQKEEEHIIAPTPSITTMDYSDKDYGQTQVKNRQNKPANWDISKSVDEIKEKKMLPQSKMDSRESQDMAMELAAISKKSELDKRGMEEIQSKPTEELIPGKEYAGRDLANDSKSKGAFVSEPQKTPDSKIVKGILDQFLFERSSLEGLTFKDPSGYWANTYLPGDPIVRILGARLKDWDRTRLYGMGNFQLEKAANRTTQPFDPPDGAALAVYLNADHAGIQDKSRMLVQVGIKGTSRFGGCRPAMNVGLALLLSDDLSLEEIARIRALLLAFAQAKDIGDRFSLTIAGKPGGMVINPGDFTYGRVTVALQNLFGNNQLKGSVLSPVEAMKSAIEQVGGADDPTAPLGSSLVILITARPIENNVHTIASMAHTSAVAGQPVSIIGIGDRINIDELNEIILMGQGNRRLLSSPLEARELVDREISAVSRVIARTVRLRIRLAPGVKLVDVLDSYRLDEAGAQRVRDAEKSIDLRIARNLGIEADRGEDEDGIQIVIPSFYAGDSHAILLDVVVSGPGTIADVTMRYKDLVRLKNGVGRANISLSRSTVSPGPLERNVLKNFLAYKLSKRLAEASDLFKSAHDEAAKELVAQHLDLLQAIRSGIPGLFRDADITNDIQML